jgi:Uma2 family endonuclease
VRRLFNDAAGRIAPLDHRYNTLGRDRPQRSVIQREEYPMSTTIRFTSADLEGFPDPIDGTRYEIIDGELIVSKQPHWEHQATSGVFYASLYNWNRQTRLGMANIVPGVILREDQDVVPDVVWVSRARLEQNLDPDGKLHGAPNLAIEVLSPGSTNEQRDRELKLKLYSRIGVEEYWIADWRVRIVEVYRRIEGDLRLVTTLSGDDVLTSPLLPGFTLPIADLWVPYRDE